MRDLLAGNVAELMATDLTIKEAGRILYKILEGPRSVGPRQLPLPLKPAL